MPVIEVKDLCVTYQKRKQTVEAICHFSAHFGEGMNVIVGYSGCGKTTLLRSILGLVPYEGKILLDGMDVKEIGTGALNFSFVSQEYVLYPHLTVFDNIAFPLRFLGAPRSEIIARVQKAAELVGITPCLMCKPKHISGGQQQRVALARAFVKNPAVCLMDEPFSNIDAQARANARQLVKEAIRRTGCMILYVTHDFQEAVSMADQLFVIHEGRLELCGAPLDVYHSGNEIVNSLRMRGVPV